MSSLNTTGTMVRKLSKMGTLSVACMLGLSTTVMATTPDDTAKFIWNRLTGTDATIAQRNQLKELIEAGDVTGAAFLAMEDPGFLDTVNRWAKPWSNPDKNPEVATNDFVATVIGLVRDELNFQQVLTGDVVYTANDNITVAPYSISNNDHYEQLEDSVKRGQTTFKDALVLRSQSQLSDNVLPSNAVAGVLTTRAAAQAFLQAGTNRAMFAATMDNFICKDMESLGDAGGPANGIRQDVSRNPANDPSFYLTYCIKCHSQMDANVAAFNYYDYDDENGRIVYTNGQIRPKITRDSSNYPAGKRYTNDQWTNTMAFGANMTMQFPQGEHTGAGAKSWAREMAGSREFAVCQVKKAFKSTCLTDPKTGEDLAAVERIADSFIQSGYNMKSAFAETVQYCAQ